MFRLRFDMRAPGRTPDEVARLYETALEGLAVGAGFDGGLLIGKRYVDASGDLEVLCTKAGASSLSVGDQVLDTKDAKPLPSSD